MKHQLMLFICIIAFTAMAAETSGQDAAEVGVGYGYGVAIRFRSEADNAALRVKACGTENVNYHAQTKKDQRPTPEAPADKALIYVMRPTNFGYNIHSKLAVDGKWMGTNRGKTYFYFTIDPGEHHFCSEAANQDAVTMAVKPGKTYYLQQHLIAGTWKARTYLTVLNETKAKEALKDLNLSVFTLKK
jgi:hypothetical protein